MEQVEYTSQHFGVLFGQELDEHLQAADLSLLMVDF